MDYEYAAELLANLSGIPVRLYRDGYFHGLYHTKMFKPDLAIWEEPNILKNTASVSYYLSPDFLFYGLFRFREEPVCMVLGPVLQTSITRKSAQKILRRMGESPSRAQELLEYLNSIPRYPLRNFLQILCSFSYFIHGEKISISDILLDEPEIPEPDMLHLSYDDPVSEHNTYDLEQQLLSCITAGHVDELKRIFRAPASGRAGKLADTTIRQQKNLFIVTATLESRAAIKGGVRPDDAFQLSDLYIQKVELLERYEDITKLNVQMALDYASRVAELQCGDSNSQSIRKMRRYILEHLTEKITTEDLANALGRSRSYLSTSFKQETGMGISQYITHLKLEEAKRLLTSTNRPLIEIADHLGFSTQSYFQNVFKKHVGMTPLAYRQQNI